MAETMAARALLGWCVAAALGLMVGSAAGAQAQSDALYDCRSAVDAVMSDQRGVEGAYERFAEHAGRCLR